MVKGVGSARAAFASIPHCASLLTIETNLFVDILGHEILIAVIFDMRNSLGKYKGSIWSSWILVLVKGASQTRRQELQGDPAREHSEQRGVLKHDRFFCQVVVHSSQRNVSRKPGTSGPEN